MKLTLAEALPLKKQISKVLQDKLHERQNDAYVEFEKDGAQVEEPLKDFDTHTTEFAEIRNDYRKIDFLLDQANIESKLEWEGEKISIKEAIELAKQIRGEVGYLTPLAKSKKMEKVVTYHQAAPVSYRKAKFDPNELADKKIRLEKNANKLSMLIEKTNHQYEIEFAEAEKYL